MSLCRYLPVPSDRMGIILKKLLPLGSSFLCYQQCICATIINYRLVIEHKRIERC